MPGPVDGIEALHRSAQVITVHPSEEMTTAWWAVRVAEEVVECRRLLAVQVDVAVGGLEVALARLEVSLDGGREHLSRIPA